MHRLLLLSVDLACMCIATILALLLRDNLEPSLVRLREILPYLAFSLLSAAIAFPLLGTNRAIWRYSTLNDYFRVLTAVLAAVLGAVALGFALNRLEDVARALPVLQGILLVALMTVVRVTAETAACPADATAGEDAAYERTQGDRARARHRRDRRAFLCVRSRRPPKSTSGLPGSWAATSATAAAPFTTTPFSARQSSSLGTQGARDPWRVRRSHRRDAGIRAADAGGARSTRRDRGRAATSSSTISRSASALRARSGSSSSRRYRADLRRDAGEERARSSRRVSRTRRRSSGPTGPSSVPPTSPEPRC